MKTCRSFRLSPILGVVVALLLLTLFLVFGLFGSTTLNNARAQDESKVVFVANATESSTRFLIDTNRMDLIPYNWNAYPFPAANVLHIQIGFIVPDGYLTYRANLFGHIRNFCAVYPPGECIIENQERAYDTTGTLSFRTVYPKYYTLLPYDNTILRVYFGSVHPVQLLCTTENSSFAVCLSALKNPTAYAKMIAKTK